MKTAPPDDDGAFADLLEDLFGQLLDGDEVDREATAARHPTVAHRLDEALALAAGAAGRRARPRPSLQGYEIVRELGRGGMGTVYLARQAQLERDVALKVLPHSFGASPRSRQRFLHEARALARIDHPHVVAIHRIVDDGEVLAFEMEFVDGPSLQQLLDHLRQHEQRTGQPATLAQVAERLGLPAAQLGARNLTQFFVRLGSKIASALAVVHAQGLVHRDLKPANILLRRNGEPVLVDFGLARLTEPHLTRTGSFVGTPVYSAPEQLRGEPTLGPPADVYGLAATLYECLTLRTPFAGHTTTDLLRRIENGRFPPLRRLSPQAPRDLETILAHAMEVDPGRRYPDAGALADDLQRLQDLQPIHARPVGPLRRIGKLVRRQRTPLLAGCVGAALVTALMVPIVDRVQAANRDRHAAAELVRQAQQQVFAFQGRSIAPAPGGADRVVPAAGDAATAALRAAVDKYERAATLAPDDASIRRERDAARLALWLRELPYADSLDLQDAVDAELAARGEGVGPLTRATARRLALGTLDSEPAEDELGTADPADRAAVGLLGFLVGDLGTCERALQSLPPELRERPLVDAALGLVHRADGVSDLAYVHLLQARRHFPESTVLLLALADTALDLGDLAQARHWLQQLPADRRDEPQQQRLELDLRAGLEPTADLAADYERLRQLAPNDPTPVLRLAQLAVRAGDLSRAAQLLDSAIGQWPRLARLRLERARLALQQRDLAAYGRQALAALDQDFGRNRSRGTRADLLEILRLGGLDRLRAQALVETDSSSTGRTLLGGELPIRSFVPPWLADNFAATLPLLHAVERQTRAFVAAQAAYRDPPGRQMVAAALLCARLPLPPAARCVAAWWPPLAARFGNVMLPLLQQLRMTLSYRDWVFLEPQPVAAAADLPPELLLGHALCTVDDVTGDGNDDVLAAAVNSGAPDSTGRVLVVDGRTATVVATLAGEGRDHMFGYALAIVGDVDGDGRRDWLVGAPAGTQHTTFGIAELWSSGTRQRLARLEGALASYGVAVAALDDVDGDGTDDFAVAASPLLRNTAGQGFVCIHSGRTRGLLRTLANDVAGVWFGACLAATGDVDGDGHRDLLVGGNYGEAPGLVRLYSSGTGAVLHTWTDDDPDHGFGTTVLGTGDLDHDSVDDVAIAAVRPTTATDRDEVHLYSGRTGARLVTLVGPTPGSRFGTTLVRFQLAPGEHGLAVGAPAGGFAGTGAIEFYTPQGLALSTVTGPLPSPRFGTALAATNDVDGDGRAELFAASPGNGPAASIWRLSSGQLRWEFRR